MSKESYARGFCKAAAAAGVDPVALAKYAYTKEDAERYKKSLTEAGEDAAPWLADWQRKQPLPSYDDILSAVDYANKSSTGLPKDENEARAVSGARAVNPPWWTRFTSSLHQDNIMPKESYKDKNVTGLRGLVNSLGVNKDKVTLREIPEDLLRGAWPAFTNAVGFGSAPVRTKDEQVITKKK